MKLNGDWNDDDCEEKRDFVCEGQHQISIVIRISGKAFCVTAKKVKTNTCCSICRRKILV